MVIFEIIVVVLIGIGQLVLGYFLWKKIELYKSIFDFEDLPEIRQKLVSESIFQNENLYDIIYHISEESDTVQITYLHYSENNQVLSKITKYINVYLIKNKGAAIDFHIIKDIIDKHTEAIEKQIDNWVPAPLYLGLAATMLGIIIGLWSVNFDDSASGLSEIQNVIQPVIDGVKWAMSASVLGLALTTLFSVWIYKSAQAETDEEKAEFLSKLQSELMPKMAKGKLPEVSILSNKLDDFGRNTNKSVNSLDRIVQKIAESVNKEKELITDLKEIDIKKVSSANLQLFKQLGPMLDSFNAFPKYYSNLNKSLKTTSNLVSNLEKFVTTTDNINIVLENIKTNIETSTAAVTFFNEHISSFSKYGVAVNEAVADADRRMSEAINELNRLVIKQFELFNEAIAGFDKKLSKAFEHSITEFTKVMDDQVLRTQKAFEESRPKFEKLNQLDKLEKLNQLDTINESINELKSDLTSTYNNGSKEIISALANIKFNTSKDITHHDRTKQENIVAHQSKSRINSLKGILEIATYSTVLIYGLISLLQYFGVI